jgi:hypothetical protein
VDKPQEEEDIPYAGFSHKLDDKTDR